MDAYSIITIPLLRAAMLHAREQDLEDFCEPLNAACREYGITTHVRQAAFLAQVTVESDHLWHQRDKYKTARGEEYASGAAYDTRTDLGNTAALDGDGQRYKGRALLQVTGLANYRKMSTVLGVDLVAHPEKLLDPVLSCRSSAYYFQSHGCNELADEATDDAFLHITKKINGGTNGLPERQAAWARTKAALAI